MHEDLRLNLKSSCIFCFYVPVYGYNFPLKLVRASYHAVQFKHAPVLLN